MIINFEGSLLMSVYFIFLFLHFSCFFFFSYALYFDICWFNNTLNNKKLGYRKLTIRDTRICQFLGFLLLLSFFILIIVLCTVCVLFRFLSLLNMLLNMLLLSTGSRSSLTLARRCVLLLGNGNNKVLFRHEVILCYEMCKTVA